MSDKKPSLLSAFTDAARSTPAAAPRASHTPRQARSPRQEAAPPTASARARPAGQRKNLIYRTSRANWERIKHLAISDDVSVQALFHLALSREFERRGLPPLTE